MPRMPPAGCADRPPAARSRRWAGAAAGSGRPPAGAGRRPGRPGRGSAWSPRRGPDEDDGALRILLHLVWVILVDEVEAPVLAQERRQGARGLGDDHAGGNQVGVGLPAGGARPDGAEALDLLVAVEVGAA